MIRHDPALGIAPEVVRGQGRNLTDLRFLLHHRPDNLGAETGAPGTSSLISQSPDCSQSQIYGSRRIVVLFQGNAVPGDHSLVESESRFRTIALDELPDRMVAGPLRTRRS